MADDDKEGLNGIDNEVTPTKGPNDDPTPSDPATDVNPVPETPVTDDQGNQEQTEEDTSKEKISILKPDFAKYLKLTRDGYTLADIIKIFGIDNEIKFGFPLKGDNEVYTEQDEATDTCFDNEDEGMGKAVRDKFFEDCECGADNNQVIISDEASEGHSVINCEEEIKDGVTFFDFMNIKAEKFFGEPEANENAETDKEKAIEELKKKYFNGNNDEWKLNPEEAEALENGGHQFYFNKAESAEGANDGEINIPRDLETYRDWANILDDTDEVDEDAYAQWLVARMKKIFDEPEPDYEPDDDEPLVNFYAVLNKLFLDFFSGLEDDEDMKEALGAFRYYNAVAQGEINPEDKIYFENYESMKEAVDAINEILAKVNAGEKLEVEDLKTLKENIEIMEYGKEDEETGERSGGIWFFLNNFVAVEVEAMRRLHENQMFDEDDEDTEDGKADTVRKMILEYARKDGLKSENDPADYSFNKFLHYGFGKFLAENAENAPSGEEAETLVDLSFLYQFKDAMLRKAALKKLADAVEEGSDAEQDLSTGVDRIALMEDSEGSDEEPATNKYMPDPEKFWTPEYKVTNLEDGLIPTKDVDVEDLTPNWIDPAANVETDDEGKSSITETVGNAVWEPFTTDEGLLGGEEVLKRTVMTNEAEAPIDEIENLVNSEETSGSGEGGEGNNEGGSSDGNEGGTDGGEGGSSTEPSVQPEPTEEEKAESQMFEPGNDTKVYVNAEGKIIDIEYPADQSSMEDLGTEELNNTVLEVVSETENEDGSWTVAYNIPGYTETYKAVQKEDGTYKVDVTSSYIPPVEPVVPTPNPDDGGASELEVIDAGYIDEESYINYNDTAVYQNGVSIKFTFTGTGLISKANDSKPVITHPDTFEVNGKNISELTYDITEYSAGDYIIVTYYDNENPVSKIKYMAHE